MKTVTRKLEELFVEITFAEDREFKTVREALKTVAQKIEDALTAVAFAEAGESETAANYINKSGQDPKHRRSGSATGRFTRLCTGRA